MKFLIKEISNETFIHIRKWIVDVDGNESCNYRSRTSINCFFYGKHHRNKTKDFLYHGESLREAIDVRGFDPEGVAEVDSIWEFYKIIGYDYKKKKYVDKTL